MGKFGNFVKNISSGIKKGATKVWEVGRNTVQKVGKVIKPAAEIAAKVGGFMSMLPGKAGLVGKLISTGGEAVKRYTNMLPDSKAKDKINESINKVVDTGQNVVNRASEGIQRFNNITQPWINSGVNIARQLV